MNYIKSILVSLAVTLSVVSCKLSTEDLTIEVQKSMEEKMSSEGISIESLVLTKKGGNTYSGILETNEPNGRFTYSVEVIYDGNNMQWEVVN